MLIKHCPEVAELYITPRKYPIHELIRRGETDVLFYRGIANAWALNFLFSDYRLYPNRKTDNPMAFYAIKAMVR